MLVNIHYNYAQSASRWGSLCRKKLLADLQVEIGQMASPSRQPRRAPVDGLPHQTTGPRLGGPLKIPAHQHTGTEIAFPKYCFDACHKTNSASAALNKWLRNHAPKGCVVHSFRHSMRDRLRAIECPSDIIDQLGGWSTAGVGSSYGNGYTIEVLGRWMSEFIHHQRTPSNQNV